MKQYPLVDNIIFRLRGNPCVTGCAYCNDKLDIYTGLKSIFQFDKFRDFDGVPLQEQAVKAAVLNKSLLVIFPTGGGKSLTFQLPALMAGRNIKGLTVVISPLQSLMKDQVENLEKKNITEAVTINGLLDPIERAKSFERIEKGEAYLLYLSPESLRSNTIERLLLGRKISRFVIDEAHCFSAWGQDFRVDYMYIAEFIKQLQTKKNLTEKIPVSCFTATAKQNVINDIMKYFKNQLDLDLELFQTSSGRKNLRYKVIRTEESKKYHVMRELLDNYQCPTIIYVSRTRKAEKLSERLNNDGYNSREYHGKMEKNNRIDNQEAFINGNVDIMVATSAFGMGVDKKDVGMVIHYDISDSLENYIQEAGRAGRDQELSANCFVLFNEEDLSKHFMLLNQTKLSLQEIQQVWKAIKAATKTRLRMSNSALEIAREAGWNDSVQDIESRVKTAIAALEDSGYIKRRNNMPRVYADSILAKNVSEATAKIKASQLFDANSEAKARRIIAKLIASRSRKQAADEIPEARVDYISEHLGIKRDEVINIIQKLREANILADAKDLVTYIDDHNSMARALQIFNNFRDLERFLLKAIPLETNVLNIKELNEQAEIQGIKKVNPNNIRKIINYWSIKKLIRRNTIPYSKDHLKISFLETKEQIISELEKRTDIAEFIIEYLESISQNKSELTFSVLELKSAYEADLQLFTKKTTIKEIETVLFYLTRIGALKIEGGFLVIYNSLNIERLEKDNKVRYKIEDYKKLKQYYEQKSQMIHIVGEYAKKMMGNYKSALQFAEDYFHLEYSSFIRKYFNGLKANEIQRTLTPNKFKQLFGELSVNQLGIINDTKSQYIVVAAGPGSGKTRILVHKLAALLLMEDVKHEQLLMLTFSRVAATEFKKRLIDLIGNAAHFVEIKTFHSYCFDLLGRVGNLEKTDVIIKQATDKIISGEVEPSKITKTVLVIDEAQDMEAMDFKLIEALIAKNENLRVIAVGDDDQNIFNFRGADSKYMQALLAYENSKQYELIVNFRSKANLIDFTNTFVETILNRMKQTPIIPNDNNLGKIEIIKYDNNELIIPAVQKMIDEGINGDTCVLTRTNEEALQISGLLKKNDIRVKLIQSKEKLNLANLVEIRYFINELQLNKDSYIIPDDNWTEAKKKLKVKYSESDNYPLCNELIKDFEKVNNKYKFKNDLKIFLFESKIEDFYDKNQGFVIVSTIHKAKGWEFDNVIIILNKDKFKFENDEEKRLIYVGMTRAKTNLTIHYNDNYFEKSSNYHYKNIKNLTYKYDKSHYNAADSILLELGFKDVYLSYFSNKQNLIVNLISGAQLKVDEEGCLDQSENRVLKFSHKFKKELSKYLKQGYVLKTATINYLIYWKAEKLDKEIIILLPQVELIKN